MTVSPQWPQDGNRQPSVGGNGVESDNSCDSPALPPTLFELPNLNQAPRVQPQANRTPTKEAYQPSPISDDEPRSPTPPAVSAAPTPVAMVPVGTEVPDGGRIAAQNSPLPERKPFTQERPAGRSWMERIGSHSIVVVLLLVVVAAGLVIGRNSRNEGLDSSLAESSNLLDFDEGTELDLPLPKHSDIEQIEFAANVEAESSTQPLESDAPALNSSGTLTDEIVSTAASATPSPEAPVESSSAVAGTFADFAARLDDPRTELTATGEAEASHVAVNKVNDGATRVDFMAASSRVPGESGAHTLPTLEELADQPDEAAEQPMADATTNVLQLSKTPAPIIDWRSYLPPVKNPANADTSVPSTSN